MNLIAQYSSVVGFMIGLPIVAGTYFQSLRARQESRRALEGTLHSANCLEFIAGDGTCINLVPLETLHSLPREGDVLLLPGYGVGPTSAFLPELTWWNQSNIFTRRLRGEARGRTRRG